MIYIISDKTLVVEVKLTSRAGFKTSALPLILIEISPKLETVLNSSVFLDFY